MLSLQSTMATPLLVLGNKAYSSWSLRGWLALKAARCDFDEMVIPLRHDDTQVRILEHSPSAKVPALVLDEVVICESLAICEWVAETYPSAGLWPEEPFERAVARSVATEMHAGFAAMRQAMPMSVFGCTSSFTPEGDVQTAIYRVVEIWNDCRRRFGAGGPWLFGSFTIADIMYAPVAIRFATFGIDLDPVSAAWRDTMLAHPHMREWIDAGRRESWRIPDIDTLFDEPWEG